MAIHLDVSREKFIRDCFNVKFTDDLMERHSLTRNQVRNLRARLRREGVKIPKLPSRTTKRCVVDDGYKAPDKPWEYALRVLGDRLRYSERIQGWLLDGKFAKVQEIMIVAQSVKEGVQEYDF